MRHFKSLLKFQGKSIITSIWTLRERIRSDNSLHQWWSKEMILYNYGIWNQTTEQAGWIRGQGQTQQVDANKDPIKILKKIVKKEYPEDLDHTLEEITEEEFQMINFACEIESWNIIL